MQHTERTTHVEPHVSLATRAEHRAIVERQTCLLLEKIHQLLLREAQLPAVKPYEEGGLRRIDLDSGDVGFQEILHIAHVVHHIGTHLLQPLRTIGIGRRRSCEGEDGAEVELTRLHETEEAFPERVVGDNRVGGDDASDVEGLARRHEGKAASRCLRRYRGKRMVLELRESHLGMDLIGDHEDAVAMADLRQADQGLFRPYHAARIVRAA